MAPLDSVQNSPLASVQSRASQGVSPHPCRPSPWRPVQRRPPVFLPLRPLRRRHPSQVPRPWPWAATASLPRAASCQWSSGALAPGLGVWEATVAVSPGLGRVPPRRRHPGWPSRVRLFASWPTPVPLGPTCRRRAVPGRPAHGKSAPAQAAHDQVAPLSAVRLPWVWQSAQPLHRGPPTERPHPRPTSPCGTVRRRT